MEKIENNEKTTKERHSFLPMVDSNIIMEITMAKFFRYGNLVKTTGSDKKLFVSQGFTEHCGKNCSLQVVKKVRK